MFTRLLLPQAGCRRREGVETTLRGRPRFGAARGPAWRPGLDNHRAVGSRRLRCTPTSHC